MWYTICLSVSVRYLSHYKFWFARYNPNGHSSHDLEGAIPWLGFLFLLRPIELAEIRNKYRHKMIFSSRHVHRIRYNKLLNVLELEMNEYDSDFQNYTILGAYAYSRKTPVTFVMSVRPSVCPGVSAPIPLRGYTWRFILGTLKKIWYDLFINCNWVVTRWQYTFTHKQYIEQPK